MYGTYMLVAASVIEPPTMDTLVLDQCPHLLSIIIHNFDFLALHQHDHTRASQS